MNKHQKYVLVEHRSNLNATLPPSYLFSERIKLTCMDVSLNYVVLAATSGGLYFLSRYPYRMIKIIPNRHVAVALLTVSPNEKNVAFATSRGIIVIYTQCFAYTLDYIHHVYSEEVGSTITAMTWNGDDELYIGNNLGKVAVIKVPSILTAIFHAPSTMLIQLDSSISQIDCIRNLLLISTLTRTYLCDTEKEHYVQIGKKLRNGNFGACFFVDCGTDQTDEEVMLNINDNLQIFCNRPGARLWEVQLDTTVTCTHQLKDSFKQNLDNWISLDYNKDPHSNTVHLVEHKTESQESLNFTKMLVFQKKFILTFNSEGFYIFDPERLTVIYHNSSLANIKDIKVIENFIYVCLENMIVCVFKLYSLEDIIIETLLSNQYHECIEICIHYYKEVLYLIEKSERLYILTKLESKLCECFSNNGAQDNLNIIFNILQSLSDERSFGTCKKPTIIVNNIHFNVDMVAIPPDKSMNNCIEDITSHLNDCQDQASPYESHMKVLSQQYEWSRINRVVKTTQYKCMLDVNDLNKIASIFQNFNLFMLKKDTDVELWSYSSYLDHILSINYRELLQTDDFDESSLNFLLRGFCLINYTSSCSCTCSFPLPSAKNKIPKYYEIGCIILKLLSYSNKKLGEEVLNDVPYMWKYVLEFLRRSDDMDILVPLLLQFNDQDLLEVFLTRFKYDTWDNAVRILIKLQQRKCINCEVKFDDNCNIITWTQLASLMIKSMGARSTINLLKHYAAFISSADLDATFYQSCIFTTAFGNMNKDDNQSSFINKGLSADHSELQAEELIAKYLSDKYKASYTNCPNASPFLND